MNMNGSSYVSTPSSGGWMSSTISSAFPNPAMSCASSYLQSFQSNNPPQITSVGSDHIHNNHGNPFFSSASQPASSNDNPFAIFASPSFTFGNSQSSASAGSSEQRSSDMEHDNLSTVSSSASSLPSFASISSALPALSAVLSSNPSTNNNNPFLISSTPSSTPSSDSSSCSSSSSSSSLYLMSIPEEVLQRRPALARLLASGSGNGKKRTIDSIVSESMRSVKSRLVGIEEENKTHSSALSAALSPIPSPPSSPLMKTDDNNNSGGMAVERSNSSTSSTPVSTASLISSERRRLYSNRDALSSSNSNVGTKRVKGVNGRIAASDNDDDKNEKEPIPFPSHDYHENSDIVNDSIVFPKQKKTKQPPSTPQSPSPTNLSSSGPVYTSDQVRKIVADALKKREELLREEYNAVLHELLREQWEQFSTFNQHYVSRQLAKSESPYIC